MTGLEQPVCTWMGCSTQDRAGVRPTRPQGAQTSFCGEGRWAGHIPCNPTAAQHAQSP